MSTLVRFLGLESAPRRWCAAVALIAVLVASVAIAQNPGDPPTPVITAGVIMPGSAGVPAQVTVWLSAATINAVSVQYATRDGTAIAGTQYQATTGTLIFAAGETNKTVEIPALPSAVSSYAWLDLSNPVNATISPNAQSTQVPFMGGGGGGGTSPTVQFAQNIYSVGESAGSVDITVTLSAASTSTVTVLYATSDGTATAPSDYLATNGTLTFNPGETSKSFPVTIVNDNTPEPTESLNLTLNAPSGATLGMQSTTTLTIIDDDFPPPTVDIEINIPGTQDDFVFLTPTDVNDRLTATAYANIHDPVSADLVVTLSNSGGGGTFDFSIDGSSWSSQLTLTLPMSGSPISFMLAGNTASTTTGDAVIVADQGGQTVGKKEGTVPKVEITFKFKNTEEVVGIIDGKDNSAQDEYKRRKGDYKLGQGEWANGGWFWGILAVGKVTPPDFTGKPIMLERSAQSQTYNTLPDGKGILWWGGNFKDFPADDPYSLPANDNGGMIALWNDTDPQSDGSKGNVYNWDTPGLKTNTLADPKIAPIGSIVSIRANAAVFATFDGKRVSEQYKWYTRQSYKKIDEATNKWAIDGSINGDNETDAGGKNLIWSLLSYGLGSPQIDSTNPAELSKSKNLDKKIAILGKNLADGAVVTLTNVDGLETSVLFSAGSDRVAGGIVGNLPKLPIGDWTLSWTNPGDPKAATRNLKITQ